MICNTCKTEVPASFEHAIVNNQCPKCGSEIMSGDKMEAFRHLKRDLGKIPMSMNAEETMDRIVTHIIYNYQIRPLNPIDMPNDPPRMLEGPPPQQPISSRGGLPQMPPDTGNAAIDALKYEVFREMQEQQREGFLGGEGSPDPSEAEGVQWDSGEDDSDLVARLKRKAGGTNNPFVKKQGTRVQRVD